VRLLYVRRCSVARKDRSDRFAKEEDRKRSEEGPRAGSSRRRQRDEHDDHLQRHDDEPIRVPKKREEAHVERIPVEEGQAPEEIEVRDDEVLIPVTEEEIVVERREVVKEVLRVRKDVVEDEEVVGVDAYEKGEHRDLDEGGRRGSTERDRRGATGREEERGRGSRSRGDRDQGGEEGGWPSAERSGVAERPAEEEAAASEPRPRAQAREDLEEIKEEIRRKEAPRSRTEEDPSGTEEATPRGRDRGAQPERAQDEDRGGQPERARDEDRGLVDKAKDAVMGSEEEPRRREGTERPNRG
jgi:uncharacterized protein (TIGR02271 family)